MDNGVEVGVEVGVPLLSFLLFKREENLELSVRLGGTGARSVTELKGYC